MIQKTATAIAFLTGLGMIFLGARFLLSPEIAETGYGLHFNEQGDYSFHYIKGIRDLFSGLIICLLVLSKQRKALGIILLTGTMIPLMDMFIVLSKDYNDIVQAIPHISAIIICAVTGIIIMLHKPSIKNTRKEQNYIRLLNSYDNDGISIMELNILPGEKTPWHYHTLFSETFEIIKGTLEVGKGKSVVNLKQGEAATIEPNEKHYYHNRSQEECVIKVTVNPGNKNFEKSLFLLKGLAKDGLSSNTGVPKKFIDLAVFVYLSNSRMLGFQKVAEPLFNYIAHSAFKKGYLDDLVNKYYI
ncbi:Cupin domain protein [Chryseobacterium soldanellicola]|uniref:Cupin domain protein n=1 Tax=Chryseobacterium soldanellicola TaxID=311333 RepID=A0A1H1CKN4_9FLAO|nr:DUF4267 domain-containing protein [Chryseobacterium soldanellicola]SDQ64727.1 Cupin domain protein [Chryseobacterium soldanellicola]